MPLTKYLSAQWAQTPGGQPNIRATGDDGCEYWIPSEGTDVSPWPQFLEEGGVIAPADPAPEPSTIYLDLKPIDFELGMLKLNITFEQIDAKIEEMQDPDRIIARIYWRRATKFERTNPLVDQIGAFFDKTPEEIDQVWLQQQATITDQVAYFAGI